MLLFESLLMTFEQGTAIFPTQWVYYILVFPLLPFWLSASNMELQIFSQGISQAYTYLKMTQSLLKFYSVLKRGPTLKFVEGSGTFNIMTFSLKVH